MSFQIFILLLRAMGFNLPQEIAWGFTVCQKKKHLLCSKSKTVCINSFFVSWYDFKQQLTGRLGTLLMEIFIKCMNNSYTVELHMYTVQ